VCFTSHHISTHLCCVAVLTYLVKSWSCTDDCYLPGFVYCRCFIAEIDLTGLQIDMALRKFQSYFRMPVSDQWFLVDLKCFMKFIPVDKASTSWWNTGLFGEKVIFMRIDWFIRNVFHSTPFAKEESLNISWLDFSGCTWQIKRCPRYSFYDFACRISSFSGLFFTKT